MKSLVIFLLGAALAGCGAISGPSGSGSPQPSTLSAVVITERDSGETLTFSMATHATLRLSTAYTWQEPRVSSTAIALEPVQYFRDPGYVEWNIRVIKPGSAQISSAGTPNCRLGTPCPASSRQFEIRIDVSQ